MFLFKSFATLIILGDTSLGEKVYPFTLPPPFLPSELGINITGTNKTSGLPNVKNSFRPALSRLDRFLESSTKFQQEINKIGTLPNKGANLLKVGNQSSSAMEQLRDEGNRGIVLRIENYSGRLFSHPVVWTRCGYQHSKFPVFQSLAPATVDIAMLHNKKEMRSSCGSISWQVMEHPAKPHKMANGKGLRFFLTWSNLDAVSSNKCKDGKRNEFIMGFKQVKLDASDHWEEEDKKIIYESMHQQDLLSANTFPINISMIHNVTRDSQGCLVESPDSHLQARGEMGTGCTTNITIQILGKRGSTMQKTGLGLVEAKKPDELWEQMIRQSWLDIVNSINRDKALYGVPLEPLLVDPLMKEPLYVNTSLLGYEVEFLMWNISISGLGSLKLDELVLERGDSLKSLETRAVLNIGNLSVVGKYQYKAVYTGWVWGMGDMDSEGEQPFRVDMAGTKIKVELGLDTVDGCNRTSDLVITKIALPILYEQVNFDFTNIGSMLGGVVSVIGEMALEFSKGIIVDLVKEAVRSEVGTFLCDLDRNSTKLDRVPVTVSVDKEPQWHAILQNATPGWGLTPLRRDILAEKFITKIFNDGVVRHFSDPQDPLVRLLDPFQLLPVNEDFRKPGLLKGHVVVCEMYLYDLSKLKLLDMELVRNEDLTYSALKVRIGLPTTSITGKYRLSNVYVMSVVPAPKSEGTMNISLVGVTVDLRVVLRTKPVRNQGNASISMELFEVEFGKDNVSFNITGLAKGLNSITNKLTNSLGNSILEAQKELLNKEIRNILYGFADCIMYKPGMGLATCMDRFWESLGFEVPFKFPTCQELYSLADKKLGLVDGNGNT